MSVDVLWELLLLPALLAGGFILAHIALGKRHGLSAMAFSCMICGLYVMSEGFPPFPPISSKQKIPYLFAIVAIAALIINLVPDRMKIVATALLLLGGFSWLVQRQLFGGSLQTQWALPILTGVVCSWIVGDQINHQSSRFAWPVTFLFMMISTSVIALLGGFIGVGQIMISVSVFLGIVVLVMFLDACRSTGPTMSPLAWPTIWVLTTTMGTLLILIGSFATNLSSPAFILILTMAAVPYAGRSIGAHRLWLQPFLFAGIAAIPTIPAILFAAFNF